MNYAFSFNLNGQPAIQVQLRNGTDEQPHKMARSAARRYALIEQRVLVRDCLQIMLEVCEEAGEIEAVASADELSDTQKDLVIIGIGAEPHAIAQLQRQMTLIRSLRMLAPVVVITDNNELLRSGEALRLGVCSVLPMNSSIELAKAAIQLALAGGAFAPLTEPQPQEPELLDPCADNFGPHLQPEGLTKEGIVFNGHFTEREVEVIERLKKGLQNKLIAYELGISESTVKVHLRHIMKKLRATNRTQVAFLTDQLM